MRVSIRHLLAILLSLAFMGVVYQSFHIEKMMDADQKKQIKPINQINQNNQIRPIRISDMNAQIPTTFEEKTPVCVHTRTRDYDVQPILFEDVHLSFSNLILGIFSLRYRMCTGNRQL